MNTETNSNTGTASTPETTAMEGRYIFAAYDSTAPVVPAEGYRLAKCLYRSDSKDGKTNSYTVIPAITDAEVQEQLTVLLPHLVAHLEDTQDSIIKAAHKSDYQQIEASSIDMAAIIDKLESANAGRLNKEVVNKWFDTEVAELLTVAFADKMGLSDMPTESEQQRLDAVIKVYRDNYGALAGANSKFVPDTCDKMVKALEVTETDSTVLGARFVARLAKIKLEAETTVEGL